jgi:hypothetical protein
LVEDLGAVLLRHVLEDRDGIVGFDIAHAFGDGLRLELFEDFVADRIVDLGQRGEVEIDAEQLDQAGTLLRLQRLQQRAQVGFMQVVD